MRNESKQGFHRHERRYKRDKHASREDSNIVERKEIMMFE